MNLEELDNFQLTKAINFNTDLNPQIFMNDKMRPLVRNKLIEIADHFREFLGVQNIALVDIEVSGSNAAYSYTPHSDVDLHLIVDFTKLPNNEVYKEMFDAKKYQYNHNHDIKIKGYEVELYVQDAAEPHHSLGSYSVMKDEWNKIPSKQRANLNDTATLLKYDKLKNLAIRALASDDSEYLNSVLDLVKKYRSAGLDEFGEFGPENLAFKMLRTDGYFAKLWAKRRGHEDSKLSLEQKKDEPDTLAQELRAELETGTTTQATEGMVKRLMAARESLFDDFDYDYIYEAASNLTKFATDTGPNEISQFYKIAPKAQIDLLTRLIAADRTKEAKRLVHKVVGTQINEQGRIVQGVNTTCDVGVNQTKIEAAKLGHTVTVGGVPPILKTNGKTKTVNNIFEGLVNELNMSPGGLQKHVNSIIQSVDPMIGLEFEVIIQRDTEANPDITKHTSFDDIREFFTYDTDNDEAFETMMAAHQEWIDERASAWQTSEVDDALNNPTVEDTKKVEIMTDLYVNSSDADDAIIRIKNDLADKAGEKVDEDDLEITEEIANEVLRVAHDAYKTDGDAEQWPVQEATDPYLLLYYEVFVADNVEAIEALNEFYQQEFYETEIAVNDYDYSVGTWLRQVHLNSMGDVYNEWSGDLTWPGGPLYQEDFDEELAHQVASDLEDISGESVSVDGGDSYGDTDTSTTWSVTSDASIKPNNDGDSGLEIVTSKMNYVDGIENVEAVIEYLKGKGAYANESTGLHINVSLAKVDQSKLDYAKLVIMLGDAHILKHFGREFNEYAVHSLTQLSDMMDARQGFERDKPGKEKSLAMLMSKMKGDLSHAVSNSFNNISFGKFASVGVRDGWIEFRSAGGEDYFHDIEAIFAAINRFIVAYAVAADPAAYKKEYAKKLYKLASNVGQGEADKPAFTLFAAFNAGMITKEELINQLKSRRAKQAAPAVDDGTPAIPKSHRDAIQMIADRHSVEDMDANMRWLEGMEVERDIHGNEASAAEEVFKNLMKNIGHYPQ